MNKEKKVIIFRYTMGILITLPIVFTLRLEWYFTFIIAVVVGIVFNKFFDMFFLKKD